MKHIFARGQPAKKLREDARPPGKVRSAISPQQNEELKNLVKLGREQSQGTYHSPEEIEKQEEKVSKAFEVISWSVTLIHGGLAISHFANGDVQKGVAALAAMLSTFGAILKRNACKFAGIFKKKATEPIHETKEKDAEPAEVDSQPNDLTQGAKQASEQDKLLETAKDDKQG